MTYLGSSTIDNAIIAYFYGATNITTIWSKQDEIRPALPYLSLSIINVEDETGHRPDQVFDATNRTYTFRNMATVRVSVFCNTDVYLGYLRDAVRYRQKTIGRMLLKAAGISIRSIGDIIDISSMIDTQFELKANCDFVFSFKETDIDAEDKIKEINGTFNGTDFGQEIYIET